METKSQGYSGAAEGQQWEESLGIDGSKFVTRTRTKPHPDGFPAEDITAEYVNSLESRLRDAEAALREIASDSWGAGWSSNPAQDREQMRAVAKSALDATNQGRSNVTSSINTET